MSALRFYVENLSVDVCRQIHNDYVEFEKKGVIGDCELRRQVELWRHAAGINDSNIVLWMDQLVKEVWRRFAIISLT